MMAVSVKSSQGSTFDADKRTGFFTLFSIVRWWTLTYLLWLLILLIAFLEQVPKFLLDSKLNFLLDRVPARITTLR